MRALVLHLHPIHDAVLAVLEGEVKARAYDRVIGLGEPETPVTRILGEDVQASDRAQRRPIATIDGHTIHSAPAHGESPREIADHAAEGLSEGDVVLVDADSPFVETSGGVGVVSPGMAGGAPGDPRVRFATVEIGAGQTRVTLEARPYKLEKIARDDALAFRKWLEAPSEPAEIDGAQRGPDAALALLAPRIGPVYHDGSGEWPEEEIDHVHDVRVASRRLRAALAIAAPLLEPKAVDRAQRRLAAFGDALGARRAADVNRERADELRAAAEGEDERAVVARIDQLVEVRRARTKERLQRLYPPARLIRHGLALLSAAMQAPDDGPPVAVGMERELARRVKKVEERLHTMIDPSDDHGHHGLRIALKRLRYTCEIVQPVLPDLVPASAAADLKVLQDALGKLHDEVELIGLVDGPRVRRRAPATGVDSMVSRLRSTREGLYETAREKVEARGPHLIEALTAAR